MIGLVQVGFVVKRRTKVILPLKAANKPQIDMTPNCATENAQQISLVSPPLEKNTSVPLHLQHFNRNGQQELSPKDYSKKRTWSGSVKTELDRRNNVVNVTKNTD